VATVGQLFYETQSRGLGSTADDENLGSSAAAASKDISMLTDDHEFKPGDEAECLRQRRQAQRRKLIEIVSTG
jgi:hypothetical protein